ncbi:MAG: 50S ribosomal protein L10 [Deltaproteobacteria bacterium]|nr:50S ribosomal protein L10 [Deltaproteobacteria bacterium]
MNKEEKKQSVAELKDRFQNSICAIVAHYRGLTVSQITDLRQKLHRNKDELKVIKNRLAKIACKDTEWEILNEDFIGPNVVGFASSDPVGLAKIFVELSKEEDSKLQLKTAVLKGKKLSLEQIADLAALPGREQLLAQFLSVLQGPVRGLVTVLSGIPRQFVQVLEAVCRAKEKDGSV